MRMAYRFGKCAAKSMRDAASTAQLDRPPGATSGHRLGQMSSGVRGRVRQPRRFPAGGARRRPVCSDIAAMVSVRDIVYVEPVGMTDGQVLDLGRHKLMWQSTPHVPQGWDCGFLFDTTTDTLFCGELFTQGGLGERPIVEDDILASSEAFRRPMDYYSHSPETGRVIDKLASLAPRQLACMPGSARQGDGAAMLRSLGHYERTLAEMNTILADMATHYAPEVTDYFEAALTTGMRPVGIDCGRMARLQ
jgi:hypothetical protein